MGTSLSLDRYCKHTRSRSHIRGIENGIDACFGPFPLGFDFNFYGQTYNKCYIQSNGLISFGSNPIAYGNQQIPGNEGYNNIIAWMWTRMSPLTNSSVYYKSFDDYFVIQFVDFTLYWTNSLVNAEVILYKSGKIVIQYKDFSDNRYLGSYTIGIENADGNIGTQAAYNKYDYLHNKLAIEFSLGGPYEPVAHAGHDQQYKSIELVTLDGTGSNDRDPNDILTYQWTQTSGPIVTLSDPSSAKPVFTPPSEGDYVFQLVVSDGTYTSYPDEVLVFIGNHAPIANAGNNQSCEPGEQVTLNGNSSYDIDTGDTLSYSWTQVSGPQVELVDSDQSVPHFTPEALGDYVFELVVNDGADTSQSDTVTIYCTYGSLPDEYGYTWIDSDCTNGPEFKWIDIQNTGTQVPGLSYNYEKSFGPFPLGFDFNFYGNIYNQFFIQASGLISFGSEAVIYSNRSIPQQDEYNNLISWFWTLFYPQTNSKIFYQNFNHYTVVQFADWEIYSGGSVNAEVIMYKSGRIVIQYKDFSDNAYLYQHTIGIENADGTVGLQVSYNNPSYLHDELAIEFSTGGPDEPVADAGENQLIKTLPSVVTLNGSGSYEPHYEPLTYQWNQISGPPVVLSDANAAEPNFVAAEYGIYEFELIVSNGQTDSVPDTVIIVLDNNFFPVADAGLPVYSDGAEVLLNGNGSYDPDHSPGELIYSWIQISGQTTVISGADTATPLISGITQTDSLQICKFQLTVYDGEYFSFPDTVELRVIPKHPASTLALESGTFDPNKPTIVYFNGGDGINGSGSWPYTSDWTSKANCLCFTNYGPDSSTSSSRNYYHCGDMLILYLSKVAPHYNKAIQTMGWSTGGQPSIDTGIRINLTYKDARYAINRITLLDECCRDFTQDIAAFMQNPVDGEQSWVDEYFGYMGNSYPGALYAHVADGDHGAPPTWYKNSLSNAQMNVFNGGLIAGAYWSVIGPGKTSSFHVLTYTMKSTSFYGTVRQPKDI